MPDIVFTPDRHPIDAVRVVPASPQFTAGRHPVRAVRIIDGPGGDVFTPAGFPVRAVRLVDAAGNYTASQTPITTQPEDMFTPDGMPIEHVCIIAGAASPEVVWTVDGRPIEAVRLVDAAGQSVSGSFYDFGSGTLPSGVTFTRASAAWGFNSSGVLTSYATDAPRFVHDPVTLQNLGLLIEGARTNGLRNSTCVGAAIGSPGTLPTNWITAMPVNNLVRNIVGTGVEDGIEYIDFQIVGTPNATTNANALLFDTNLVVAAATGQVWTSSFYVRLIAGSSANISMTHTVIERPNGFITSVVLAPTTAPLRTQRTVVTRTFTDAATTNAQNNIVIAYTIALPIDITLRIGLPQLELGEGSSSPIKTSTVAVTRAIDVALVTDARALTDPVWVVKGRLQSYVDTVNALVMATRDTGSSTQSVQVYRQVNTQQIWLQAITGGVPQASLNAGSIPNNSNIAIAVRSQTNDFAASLNGGAVLTSGTGTLPTPSTTFRVGGSPNIARYWNSTIRSIETRATASDAELVTLSTL